MKNFLMFFVILYPSILGMPTNFILLNQKLSENVSGKMISCMKKF